MFELRKPERTTTVGGCTGCCSSKALIEEEGQIAGCTAPPSSLEMLLRKKKGNGINTVSSFSFV